MKSIFLYTCLLALALFGQIFAITGGVIGVISPRQTVDGRALLWQNFDSDEPHVQTFFFKGDNYDFIGLVNGRDSTRVFSGLNTAGFGIVMTSFDSPAPDSSENPFAVLVKEALAVCGRIDDFNPLFQEINAQASHVAFACIDAYGGAALFDVNGRHSAANPVESPEGFFVRAGFSFSRQHNADAEFWRYHKSRELFRQHNRSNSVKTIIQNVSRNVQTFENDPYPLPFSGRIADAPQGFIRTENSINQHNTVACVVIQGVRPLENPEFSTLWTTLGEPLCGIAVPNWPAAGETPFECRGNRGNLNSIIISNKKAIYNRKESAMFADTELLAKDRGLLALLLAGENKLFNDTQKALAEWRQQPNYLERMIDFQTRMSTRTFRSIHY